MNIEKLILESLTPYQQHFSDLLSGKIDVEKGKNQIIDYNGFIIEVFKNKHGFYDYNINDDNNKYITGVKDRFLDKEESIADAKSIIDNI